jgi:hypothetical protein
MSERIVVIVNKWYECDPFLAALLNENGRPPACPVVWLERLRHPRKRTNSKTTAGTGSDAPRAELPLGAGVVQVWCISDLMEDLPDVSAAQSNPRRKAERLPLIFRGTTPRLVIAVGTAGLALGPALPGPTPAAGHVVIGTSVFMHDFHPERAGQDDHWDGAGYDKLIPSSLPQPAFDDLVGPLVGPQSEVAKRFALPPLSAAPAPQVLARYDFASVGSLNVVDPREYVDADRKALDGHLAAGGDVELPRSVETTHGLIRVCSDAPFLFVSAIANRALAATEELLPRKFAQETTAATNAGVAIGWLLPRLEPFLQGAANASPSPA